MERVEKPCNHCGDTKPLSEFYKNKNNKSGIDSWCKACRRKYKRQHRARNYERILHRTRELYRAKRDGVEPSELKRDTGIEITGDPYKDLAVAILKRATWDVEGRYVIVKGSDADGLLAEIKEDALAWFQKSEQCRNFLDWLGIQTDLTYLLRRCTVE